MLDLSRRNFVVSTALASAFGMSARLTGSPAFAQKTTDPAKGFHKYKVGAIEVTALYDGIWEKAHDPAFIKNASVEETKEALAKAGLTIDDLDLIEINEAFAAVVLRFVKDMGLDMEKVNVNGGAIAMGHPLGATGGMILGTLIDELHRTGGRYGLATLCVGGGMGIATVVEAI
jgi:acetyl-CoA acetyltransferase